LASDIVSVLCDTALLNTNATVYIYIKFVDLRVKILVFVLHISRMELPVKVKLSLYRPGGALGIPRG
jgi:hypothetical protein